MIGVRPFILEDLRAATELGARAQDCDPSVEPFAVALEELARSSRSLLPVWRVAEQDGAACGIAFAARDDGDRLAVYATVLPRARRGGLGRALIAPALERAAREGMAVRSRAFAEPAGRPGSAFLAALGFEPRSFELLLARPAGPCAGGAGSARVRKLEAKSGGARDLLARLHSAAGEGQAQDEPWAREEIVLLAERASAPAGYLRARVAGGVVAIEELAVLPGQRRSGVGRALVRAALAQASHLPAVLAVAAGNGAACAFYAALGFRETRRRRVFERPVNPSGEARSPGSCLRPPSCER